MSDDTPKPTASRAERRRKRNLIASIAGGVVVLGATVAIILAAAGSRSGTLVDGASGASGINGASGLVSSAFTGDDAAALLAKFPAESISAGSVQLGPNIAVTSMSVSLSRDGTFTGTGTVEIAGKVSISVSATITDASNWTLTIDSAGTQPFSVGTTGITIDPSTISGTISETKGAVSWNVVGTTVTWPIATGASLTTNFSIGDKCPLSDSSLCPGGDNVYIGLPSGSLSISGYPTVSLAGGVTIGGAWARLDGSATASASFSVNGASVSMSNPSMTVWRGTRTDSFDANLTMPNTSALTNGTSVELCGDFSIDLSPLVNQSTGGCLEWTPSGVVLAQAGGGSGMTLSGGSTPSGTSAAVAGFGWTSLSNAALSKLTLPNSSTTGAVGFGTAVAQLIPSTITIGGEATLPGVVTSAVGLGSSGITVDLSGQIGTDGLSISASVPVSIKFGKEPMQVSIDSLTLALTATSTDDLSFSLGTQTDLTLGYGTTARTVQSSVQLEAQTAPATGFTLSLNAVGVPGGGDTMDGLTPQTQLAHPSKATFLVPDLFGINGVNLWSLTGQIGYTNGSPSLSFSTTSYVNPSGSNTRQFMGCTGYCDDSDWMIGTLVLDVSYTTPCLVYSFDGSTDGGYLAISNGALKAYTFQIGMAPDGCTVDAGSTNITLPKGFAGLSFDAAFGSTSVDVQTQVSTDGFTFKASLGNVSFAGVDFEDLVLDVSISDTDTSATFDATWDVDNVGTSNVHATLNMSSGGVLSASLSASVPNFKPRVSGTFEVSDFAFTGSLQLGGSCGYLNASASGTVAMMKNAYSLHDGEIDLDCNGLQSLSFFLSFKHGAVTDQFSFSYSSTTQILTGSFGFSVNASWSNSPCTDCLTYSGSATGNVALQLTVDMQNDTGAFSLSGSFSGSGSSHDLSWSLKVTANAAVTWTSDGSDFSGSVGLSVKCDAYKWNFTQSV